MTLARPASYIARHPHSPDAALKAPQPISTDPIAVLQRLIACRSVTPAEGGALDYLTDVLGGAGFATERLSFSAPGTPDIDNLFAMYVLYNLAKYGVRVNCVYPGPVYTPMVYAKGLSEQVVVIRHALKNALIPIVTLIGLQIRILLGGSVLVETVFNIPGMGRLIVSSTFDKDFITVQAVTLVIAIVVLFANLIVDISYGWLDPRIRYS